MAISLYNSCPPKMACNTCLVPLAEAAGLKSLLFVCRNKLNMFPENELSLLISFRLATFQPAEGAGGGPCCCPAGLATGVGSGGGGTVAAAVFSALRPPPLSDWSFFRDGCDLTTYTRKLHFST